MCQVRAAHPVEARLTLRDGWLTIGTDGIDGKAGGAVEGRVGARFAARGVICERRVVAGAATVESVKFADRCRGDGAVATIEACCLDDKRPVRFSAEHVTGVAEEASHHIRGQPDRREGAE